MPAGTKISPNLRAVLEAAFVTFLWSTSWVLIKFGLRNSLPPLTFAGLRYTTAFICLTPFIIFNKGHLNTIRSLTKQEWIKLTLLGLIFYSFTQGAQYLSMSYMPAAMVALLLNMTPIFVALFGMFLLGERPTIIQWLGIMVCIGGTAFYFYPFAFPQAQILGLIFAILCIFANTGSSVMGRYVNYSSRLPALIITFVSMGIGSIIMLASGLIFQGIGKISITDWGIIGWLAVVNTAFAFTLWNKTLRVLSAVESSILNSLMLPQISILAVIFLGETLSLRQIAGLILVSSGVLMVQLKKKYS